MRKILFVGGGSVGHIAPAVAVWEELKKRMPDASAHFVVSTRPDDAGFLLTTGLPFTTFDAPRLSCAFPYAFWKSCRAAAKIIERERPALVFSKGGYVSVPFCFVAHRKGIPIVLHESDVVGGYANRIVGRWAKTVCQGFQTRKTNDANHIFTGNPVRAGINKGSRDEGLRITGLSGKKPILLVMGGSQGAQAINDAIVAQLPDLLLRCDIIHITGRGKNHTNHGSPITDHYYATEFATSTLPHLYACSDIALSRAGAGSIAELAANRIPTILVPLRGVGHDHQQKNAEEAELLRGCMVLQQNLLSSQLLTALHSLVSDEPLRRRMSENFAAMWVPDAACLIAKCIAECLARSPRAE